VRNKIRIVHFATVLLAALPLHAQARVQPSFTISGMQAKLYFPESGTFSDDMLAVPVRSLNLWNTIIGAGWAEHPSNATLVLVRVAGPAGVYARGLSVELTVTNARTGGVVLRRRIEAENGRQEGFWIYDTGCVPLVLRARLIGQASSPSHERKIPFECGE
jgi:hypothetical protein